MSTAFIAKGLQRFVLIGTSVGAMINIILNIILIPRWGPLGAAWATVISYNLAGFFIFGLFSSTRDLWITGAKISFKPFLIGLSCVVILSLTRNLFTILLVPILYLVSIFALNIWKKDDITEILSLLFRPKDNIE